MQTVGDRSCQGIKSLTCQEYSEQLISILCHQSEREHSRTDIEKEIEQEIDEVTHEIRQYSMDVCKQMKNKLMHIDRKEFEIRKDRGSIAKEQLYIDCSTSVYEYLRFHMINILKEKMDCIEDMSRRRLVTDADVQQRSEVEAQYSISFLHDDIRHKVHITFYYTKCSLWIQGSSCKINNMTVAQFFTYYYLENIINIIKNTVPLEKIGETLRQRIHSFLDDEQIRRLTSGEAIDTKCSVCKRKCHENGKSMKCGKCSQYQHFQCVGIKTEEERKMYVNGLETFVCDGCLPKFAAEGPPRIETGNDNTVTLPTATPLVPPPPPVLPLTPPPPDLPLIPPAPKPLELGNSIDLTIESVKQTEEPVNISSDPSCTNADKILIRRLQAQITKISEVHAAKERAMEIEISTLKESYRVCVAKYEKERETKDTLQECVKALQAQDEKKNPQKPKNRDETTKDDKAKKEETSKICKFFNRRSGCKFKDRCKFVHQPQSRNPDENINKKACIFFNRRSGCRNGNNCRYAHLPPCPANCDSKACGLNHSETQDRKQKLVCDFFNTPQGCKKGANCRFLHNPLNNNNFLSPAESENRPPDTLKLMDDIKDMIQLQVKQIMNTAQSQKNIINPNNQTQQDKINLTQQTATPYQGMNQQYTNNQTQQTTPHHDQAWPGLNTPITVSKNNNKISWQQNSHPAPPLKVQPQTHWGIQRPEAPIPMYHYQPPQSYQLYNQPTAVHSLY